MPAVTLPLFEHVKNKQLKTEQVKKSKEIDEKISKELTKPILLELEQVIKDAKLDPEATKKHVLHSFDWGYSWELKPYETADLILPVSLFRKDNLRAERCELARIKLTEFYTKHGITFIKPLNKRKKE